MKKLINLLSALFILLISTNAEAQLFTKYTAEAELTTAINFSKSNSQFQSPVVMAIATMKDEFVVSGIPVKPGMSMTNGKSEAWVYVIDDDVTNERTVIGVVKSILGTQAVDISDQGGITVPSFITKPITGTWIDSDELVDYVSANTSYQNYIKAYPTAEPTTTILTINTFNSLYTMNYPYWINNFGENDEFVCYTDAITGETDCQTISSVKQVESVSNSFSPNPANNYININFENNINNFESIKIVDLFGNTVYESRNRNTNQIDITNLANGAYTIMYEYKNKIETEKLLIQK